LAVSENMKATKRHKILIEYFCAFCAFLWLSAAGNAQISMPFQCWHIIENILTMNISCGLVMQRIASVGAYLPQHNFVNERDAFTIPLGHSTVVVDLKPQKGTKNIK
jgi:hypothetical protein